tara:strand:+ start:809 stop:2347 length:1539 start_codon:yes stop_codon:yes gene_type:complete
MSLNIPSSQQIFERVNTDIINELNELDPYLRTSFIRAINAADSKAFYELYQTVQQMINLYYNPSGEYLDKFAAEYGLTRNPATLATGNIVFTGTATASIPIATQVTSDSGDIYQTTAAGTITATILTISSLTRSGSTVTATTSGTHGLASSLSVVVSGASETEYNGTHVINVTGLTTFTYSITATPGTPATGTIQGASTYSNIAVTATDYGESSNRDAGSSLSIASPVSGVNATAYVDFSEIAGGSDVENDDSFNSRYIFRRQNLPANFNKTDIIQQAKLINGVTRVWVQGAAEFDSSLIASGVTRNGDHLAVFNKTAHGLYNGQSVTVTGANEAEYNVVQKKVLKIDANNFGYLISGTPASPATGTITVNFPVASPGQVRVFFVTDNATSIFPSAVEIAKVYDKILEIKPSTMSASDVLVDAPSPVAVNFAFLSITPNTASMQTAIQSALTEYFNSSANLSTNMRSIDYNSVINSVADSGGNQLQAFTLTSPTTDVEVGISELAVLGTVTF